jgi:hypothetical protein
MISKITGGPTTFLFDDLILNKYKASYYRCNETGFIQTSETHWLAEAYSSAITSLDLGLIDRNINFSKTILPILLKYFYNGSLFLDYGGGYGMFVRMMRDKGFNFRLYDAYCENMFAKNYSLNDLGNQQFDLITAFEVAEHLDYPMSVFGKLFEHTDTIIFSTELVPDTPLSGTKDWWYFSPGTGQHIAFYTIKSLAFIAEKFGAVLYSNKKNLHIITKRSFASNPVAYVRRIQRIETITNSVKKRVFYLLGKKYKKTSLLGPDILDAMNS